MPAPRVWTTLRNLILAIINSTLILLALCLWLGWRLTAEVHAVTDEVARNLAPVQPLRDEVAALGAEVAGLRADLASVGDQAGTALPETVERLGAEAERFQAKLAALSEQAETVATDPGLLIDRAVAAAAVSFGDQAQRLKGCTAAPAATD
jgi:hypothetical protein